MVYRQGGNDMKVYTSIPLFFVLAVLASGCTSVSYTLLGAGQGHSPVPESEVEVFTEEDELPEHTRIALLHHSFDMNDIARTNPGKLVAMLRNKAGALGANGIVVAGVKDMGDGVWVVNDTDRVRMVADPAVMGFESGSAIYVDAIAIRVE